MQYEQLARLKWNKFPGVGLIGNLAYLKKVVRFFLLKIQREISITAMSKTLETKNPHIDGSQEHKEYYIISTRLIW